MSDIPANHADNELEDGSKRDFIFLATGTTAAAGAAALAWPLVAQMGKAADTLAAGSIEIDLSKVAEGQQLKMLWRGKPVFVRHRTAAEIKEAVETDICVPVGEQGKKDSEFGGWYCPCHGSHYDTSGRIRKGPAPKNLEVPTYTFISENVIKVG